MTRDGPNLVAHDCSFHYLSFTPAHFAMTSTGPHASSRPAPAGATGVDSARTEPPKLAFPDSDSAIVRDQLEELDDAMFSAMDGVPGAIDKARSLWFNAVASLPWSLVEESRDQYLRYAAEVVRGGGQTRRPEAVLAALDVIELLARAA